MPAKKPTLLEAAKQLSPVRSVKTWLDAIPEPKRSEVRETLEARARGELACTIQQLVALLNKHGVQATTNKVNHTIAKMRGQI